MLQEISFYKVGPWKSNKGKKVEESKSIHIFKNVLSTYLKYLLDQPAKPLLLSNFL